MGTFGENENLEYVICLNSCNCEVFNQSQTTYEIIKRGCLAKFQYRESYNGLMQTLVTNKSEVYMQDSLHYISIDLKLFKYLNAINDFEERLKFYNNVEKLAFVLNLERNSIVSVGLSSGKQTQAVFHEINENEEKIFITVELLERPFKYSLPANMVQTIAVFESSQSDNRGCFEKFCRGFLSCLGLIPTHNFNCSTLEYWRYYDNEQNGTINIVSVGPVNKKIISQNPGGSDLQENNHEPSKNLMLDRSYNKASNNEPENGFFTDKTAEQNETKNIFDQINIDSNIPSDTSLSSETQINSLEINTHHEIKNCVTNEDDVSDKKTKLCVECLNVYDDNSCLSCDMKKMSGQNDSNILLDTSLPSETPITPLKINTHVTNEDDLPDNSKIAVRPNQFASSCIICKNYLDISEGVFLILCNHTFCETCIKNYINLEMLAHTNVIPCCQRSIDLNEIKYFLPTHEYEQFKASYKQQCFDKNCSGYHLWEKRGEKRPITFTCNKCELENCSKCETIHVNLPCTQYDKIRNSVDNETVEVFLAMIREGTAMPCPKCEALIEKDEGCDWVQCPFCKIEICWATRGPRWGPNGKGDTSGGCGCDFKGKKCV